MIPKTKKELAVMLFAMEVNEMGVDINGWKSGLGEYREVARSCIQIAEVLFDELSEPHAKKPQ